MAGTRKYASPGGKNKVGLLNSEWAKSKQCLFEHVSKIMSVGKMNKPDAARVEEGHDHQLALQSVGVGTPERATVSVYYLNVSTACKSFVLCLGF